MIRGRIEKICYLRKDCGAIWNKGLVTSVKLTPCSPLESSYFFATHSQTCWVNLGLTYEQNNKKSVIWLGVKCIFTGISYTRGSICRTRHNVGLEKTNEKREPTLLPRSQFNILASEGREESWKRERARRRAGRNIVKSLPRLWGVITEVFFSPASLFLFENTRASSEAATTNKTLARETFARRKNNFRLL